MEKYQQFWCFRLGAITRKISREYNTRFLEFGLPWASLLFYLICWNMMEQESKILQVATTG